MWHLAHDILETCHVQNSGMTEPKWSGLHGSRRCTKNKTHGIVGTREVSSHGNLFTPTWKSFAQALKSGWARPFLHKILFRMRVPEKFSEFPFFVGWEKGQQLKKQRFCDEGCTPSTHPISNLHGRLLTVHGRLASISKRNARPFGPFKGSIQGCQENPGATMTSHQKSHPADPPMTYSNGINLTLTKVGCAPHSSSFKPF